jgi:hypothetical protein
MEQSDACSAIAIPQRTAGEELWSLKIGLAKTGLSRSTLYAYIADRLQCRGELDRNA